MCVGIYKYRTPAYYSLYKETRNNVTRLKRSAVKSYFKKKCSGGTRNKDFWKTIRPFHCRKSLNRSEIYLREGEEIVTNEKHLCSIFNDFFSNIGSDIGVKENNNHPIEIIIDNYKEHKSIAKILSLKIDKNSFSLRPINITTMKKYICKLKVRKSCGYDDIPASFIKVLKNDLAECLTVLVNKCISQSVFPSQMKLSNITPVHKKKDRLEKDNYRSINLLPIISKLLENAINDQIYEYMSNIFHTLLSGFRKKHGCKDILCKLTEDWRKALDNKHNIGVLAIDLSKAFDCMPHGLLLAKMYHYGIDIAACQLIKSYLHDRKQRVKIGTHVSPWTSVTKGVPQGSILGPLLFNIFINDLMLLDIKSAIYNYADDNTITYIHDDLGTIKYALQRDTTVIMDWFELNMMRANPEKFQLMFLGKSAVPNDYINLNGTIIHATSDISVLGVEFDDTLDFSKHISTLCSKVSKQINALVRLKNLLDTESRMALYNSYIRCNFDYCSTVWMFTNKSNLQKLDKLNERAIRMVHNEYGSDYIDLLSQTKSHNIYNMCLKTLAVEMYKVRNNISPDYLMNLFVINCPVYGFRDTNTFSLPHFNTKRYGYHSMQYIGSKLWNDIHVSLKDSDLCNFKRCISTWLNAQTNVIDRYF